MTFLFAEHGHPGLLLFNGLRSFSCLAPSGKFRILVLRAPKHTLQTLRCFKNNSHIVFDKAFYQTVRSLYMYIYSSLKISQALGNHLIDATAAVGWRQSGRMWICGSCCVGPNLAAWDKTFWNKTPSGPRPDPCELWWEPVLVSATRLRNSLKTATYMNHGKPKICQTKIKFDSTFCRNQSLTGNFLRCLHLLARWFHGFARLWWYDQATSPELR